MKFKLILLAVLSGALLLLTTSLASQNKGAADITLNGGTRGKVHFPHQKHIDTIGDCNVCHDLYPDTAGIIDTLKAQGKLKKKQVMNGQCTRCHRAAKKEGNPSGPTTCSKCHTR